MRYLRVFTVLLFLTVPGLALADAADIPGSATWYLHADLEAMRNGEAGRGIYNWLDEEVFSEVHEQAGLDVGKEVRWVTAYSKPEEGPVVVLDGEFSQETKDKVLALAALDGDLSTHKMSGKTYYFYDGDESRFEEEGIDIGSLEDNAFFSFAVKDKVLFTSTREQMEALLKSKGRIAGASRDKDALFVLRAERSLIQAGVNAEDMQEDDDWDSNILRNTKKVAVLLADLGGKLGIEAHLMATEPEIANSLASIVRGLISLQSFNDEMDPEVSSVLQSTKVNVSGSTLMLSLALNPDTVVSALEN